jgi:flagellar protein FliS
MPLVDPRAAYAQTARSTASPQRLLVMLYDRLVRDLVQARDAVERRDHANANELLLHAQEIVQALRAALDHGVWDGARDLDSLYGYLLRHLLVANVRKCSTTIGECLAIVRPLSEAWRHAFGEPVTEPAR